MSIFVIGDLQGCATDLDRLLRALPLGQSDEIWICGDLVNRGPDSVGTLRLLRGLKQTLRCVLGNHDLAVLASATGVLGEPKTTARAILAEADGEALLAWLVAQPLLVHAQQLLMVHAGLPPQWNLATATAEARAVEAILRGPDSARLDLYRHMYGDEPDCWSAQLGGWERLRFAINAFTRMRQVDRSGRLDLRDKGAPGLNPALIPWFKHPQRQSRRLNIAFGHWSTLQQVYWPAERVWGLDSGCVWGGRLTALQWPERRLYSVPCAGHRAPGEKQE